MVFRREVEVKFREAQRLYEHGLAEKALTLLDAIARSSPNHPEVMYERARCLHELGRDPEAYALCNKLLTMHRDPRGAQLREQWWAESAAAMGAPPETWNLQPRRQASPRLRPLLLRALVAVLAGALLVAFFAVKRRGTPRRVAQAPLPVALPVSGKETRAADTVFARPKQPPAPSPARLPASPDRVAPLVLHLGGSSGMEALFTLCETVTRQDLPYLQNALLTAQNTARRGGLVQVLGLLGAETSIEPVSRCLLGDPSPEVRRLAAASLGYLGADGAVPALMHAANQDTEYTVRNEAIIAIQRLVGPERFANHAALLAPAQLPEEETLRAWLNSPHIGHDTEPAFASPGALSFGYESGTYYGLYVPQTPPPTGAHRVLVAVHNSVRRLESVAELIEAFRPFAEQHGMAVLAPYFDRATFYRYASLNAEPFRPRADIRLLEMIASVSKRVRLSRRPFLWYEAGPAAGFVPYFALTRPEYAARAAVLEPQGYPHLNPDVVFPAGTKTNPFAADLRIPPIARFLHIPLLIMTDAPDGVEWRRFQAESKRYGPQNASLPGIRKEALTAPNDNRSAIERALAFLAEGVSPSP